MKTILIFDRYPNMLKAFHRFLSQENYQVITTDSLEEVVTIIEVIRLDLVIMDTGRSPEDSVLQTLKVVREKNLILPILLTATYSDTLTEKVAKELGAADLILKPFDPKEVKRIVKEMTQKNNLN